MKLRGKWKILPKLVAMVGGFLILAGVVVLGISALALFGFLEVDLMLEQKYILAFSSMMTGIGLLDIFSAAIISRWRE